MHTFRRSATGELIYLTAPQYREFQAKRKAYTKLCDHPRLVRCRRGNATVDQCSACGSQVGGAFSKPQNFGDLPQFESGLASELEEQRHRALLDIEEEFVALSKQGEMSESEKAQHDLAYAAYLRSPAWQKIRAKVLKRAKGVCEGCLEADATEVHHKDYRYVKDELLFDLVALCRACHLKAHPEHADDPEYSDYSPCNACRFGQGGGFCTKFESPVYLEFQVGGRCFPPGAAAEELR